jgi:MYXO-CTERM domain-containing protein
MRGDWEARTVFGDSKGKGMKPEQLTLRTGAERAAMLTGWAGAVALISATGADGAIVVSNGATLTHTVIQTPGVGASVAREVGIQLDGNRESGFWGVGDGGVDIAFLANAFGEIRVGTDYYGYIQLAANGLTAGSTRALLQKFTSPDSVASAAVSFLNATTTGVLFQTATTAGAGYWENQSGYIGFRIGQSGVGPWTYGWVAISVPTGLGSVSISNWQPDAIPGTTNQHAPAGSGTPEPAAAGLGLLALGAAGVLRHKRRRKDEVA